MTVIAISCLVALPGISCGGDGENGSVLVLAAASMTDALVEVGESYKAETGNDVTFSFGGSTALARQVEFGAPADAVIFAGSRPMDQLTEAGRIEADSQVDLLKNRLVVIAEPGSSPLARTGDLQSTTGRIAVADPTLAPAGAYAKQALETAGTWDSIETRVVPTLDVRAAVGAVATGGVSYGVVYATDAAVASGVAVILEVPETLHDPIIYPAAVIDGSNSDAAVRFLKFLRSERSLAVFEKHGFLPSGD